MTAGTLETVPATCHKAGCGKPAQARGMCGTHYHVWRRANPGLLQLPVNLKTIEQALPGTRAQIMDRTGMCWEAIERLLVLLHNRGRAHIASYTPPTVRGTRWRPVWVAGPGEHVVPTAENKAQWRAAAAFRNGFVAAERMAA